MHKFLNLQQNILNAVPKFRASFNCSIAFPFVAPSLAGLQLPWLVCFLGWFAIEQLQYKVT